MPDDAPTPDTGDAEAPAGDAAAEQPPSADAAAEDAPKKEAATESPAASLKGDGATPAKAPTDKGEANASPRRVLVVEDSKPLRRMLCKILETQGFIPFEAENGKAALDVIHKESITLFQLILVDLMMPVMDGARFVAEARKEFGDSMPPVLVCSSRSDREAIHLVMKLGVAGYVLKPFKTETVINKVNDVFAGPNPKDEQ